jgi:hypothetical protein
MLYAGGDLTGTEPCEHDIDGAPQHIDLHFDAASADISEVMPVLLDRCIDALGIATIDLGEAGDARAHTMALMIARDEIEVMRGVVPVVGPRAD